MQVFSQSSTRWTICIIKRKRVGCVWLFLGAEGWDRAQWQELDAFFDTSHSFYMTRRLEPGPANKRSPLSAVLKKSLLVLSPTLAVAKFNDVCHGPKNRNPEKAFEFLYVLCRALKMKVDRNQDLRSGGFIMFQSWPYLDLREWTLSYLVHLVKLALDFGQARLLPTCRSSSFICHLMYDILTVNWFSLSANLTDLVQHMMSLLLSKLHAFFHHENAAFRCLSSVIPTSIGFGWRYALVGCDRFQTLLST